MARIGIFGGTFNPPHIGHIKALRRFADLLKLDRILMVPTGTPPHKVIADGSPSSEQRLALCEAAASELPNVEVCDLELRRNGPSYTADTVEELKRQFSNDDLFLLLGSDAFLRFGNWYMPQRVTACASIAVIHRFSPNSREHSEVLTQKRKLETGFGANVTVLESEPFECSSTSVRAMLAFDCAEHEIPNAVLQSIRTQGLYLTGESLKSLPFEQMKRISLSLHKEKRRPHAAGCCETAIRLAERWGCNSDEAARAGILHDITKALNSREQLILCRKYDIVLDRFTEENEKLLHAVTGAEVARSVFGESEAVCSAIRWHTTGKPEMTALEKIIYLADLIEPGRSFDGVEALRMEAERDLDRAMELALERSVSYVRSNHSPVHPDSLTALLWFREQNRLSCIKTKDQL